jgi:hypothetical protein
MTETHRLIVDRHEGEITVVELDGQCFADVPRWMLPRAARGDDVLVVRVETEADRAVVTITRDVDATARAKDAARAAVDRLRQRNPGGDVTL